jgi:molecular chaperone DnaK (HSP70)
VRLRRTLFSQQSTRIEIESFEEGNDFSETLTCAKSKDLNMDLIRKTIKHVEMATATSVVPYDDTIVEAETRLCLELVFFFSSFSSFFLTN